MKPEKIQQELDINDIEAGITPFTEGNRSIISVAFEEPIKRPDQLFKGIKRLKATAWYKSLTEKGLNIVPIPQKRSSKIALIIGTAALIGTAYIGYRHYKEKNKNR